MWPVTWTAFERAVRFALGVALIWHQGVIASAFNPYVLTAGLTLVGAGEAIRWDLARRSASSNGGQQPPPSSEPAPSPSSPRSS